MYTHLLVPLDGTDLSMGNVTAAVHLASALDAKVSFCHVVPDYAALRSAHRSIRMEGGQGLGLARDAERQAKERANALLSKAAAYAKAQNVACDTLSVTGDRTPEAIVKAAADHACDLIVMASHAVTGLRSLAHGSVTSKVLRESRLPVLITQVQANDPQAQAHRACALIQDEHRSLAAVLHGMDTLLIQAGDPLGPGFDHEGFALMLRYVHDFPQRLHHPKEEQSLHRLLRSRDAQSHALLEILESQHRQEHGLVAALQSAFPGRAAGARIDDAALQALAQAHAAFAAHVWEHLKTEEQVLLPMALEALTEKDWSEVAKVFEGNRDPGYGGWSDEAFRRHFMKLAEHSAVPKAAQKR